MLPKILDSRTVLIIDDEEVLRSIIAEEFSDYGAQVATAGNLTEALKLVQEKTFDAIITDINMPGGSGVDFVLQIESMGNTTSKIFVCSGSSQNIDSNPLPERVLAVFPKPFDRDIMVKAVCQSLGIEFFPIAS